MEHQPTYTLLINTSDGFQDCWHPFFQLYSTYWNAPHVPILLNTENITDYTFPGLDIRCSAVQKKAKLAEPRRLTWSECLNAALEQVETELVLYMQEDYFIEQPVLHEVVEEMANYLLNHPEISYVGLTHFGNMPPFKPWDTVRKLVKVGNTSYKISTQAGLWRKATLLKYLRPQENGWMFEIYGTRRAWRSQDIFLTLDRTKFNGNNPVILYTHTGIIKGKWHKNMPALFSKHGIEMDFTKRGFYTPKFWLIRKWETGVKLLKEPKQLIKGLLGR
jgi:hypothetical protein